MYLESRQHVRDALALVPSADRSSVVEKIFENIANFKNSNEDTVLLVLYMLGGDLSFGFPDLQGRDNKLFEAQTRCLEKR